MSQLHTRSTQSKRLSRPHTSTTAPLRLTPPQLLPSLLPQLSPVLDTPLLPQLLLPPTLLPQLLPLSLLKQLNNHTTTTISTTTINHQAVQSKVTTYLFHDCFCSERAHFLSCSGLATLIKMISGETRKNSLCWMCTILPYHILLKLCIL